MWLEWTYRNTTASSQYGIDSSLSLENTGDSSSCTFAEAWFNIVFHSVSLIQFFTLLCQITDPLLNKSFLMPT